MVCVMFSIQWRCKDKTLTADTNYSYVTAIISLDSHEGWHSILLHNCWVTESHLFHVPFFFLTAAALWIPATSKSRHDLSPHSDNPHCLKVNWSDLTAALLCWIHIVECWRGNTAVMGMIIHHVSFLLGEKYYLLFLFEQVVASSL